MTLGSDCRSAARQALSFLEPLSGTLGSQLSRARLVVAIGSVASIIGRAGDAPLSNIVDGTVVAALANSGQVLGHPLAIRVARVLAANGFGEAAAHLVSAEDPTAGRSALKVLRTPTLELLSVSGRRSALLDTLEAMALAGRAGDLKADRLRGISLKAILATWAVHDLRRYDLIGAARALSVSALMGAGETPIVRECVMILLSQQRPDGAFGFIAEQVKSPAAVDQTYLTEAALLPITTSCLTAIADCVAPGRR